MMMHPIRPIHHSLQTDAGESIRQAIGNYLPLIHCDVTGTYYKLVTWQIERCVFASRWQTLTQWEAVPGLYENMPDGLGTM